MSAPVGCSNPRPVLRPGATPTAGSMTTAIACLFQSSPGFEAGRYPTLIGPLVSRNKFQSSPGFEAGRYSTAQGPTVNGSVFQSSPGFEAGRYITL